MQSTKRALQCEGRGVETVEGVYFIPPFVIGRAAALNSESKEQPCLYKPFFSGVFVSVANSRRGHVVEDCCQALHLVLT